MTREIYNSGLTIVRCDVLEDYWLIERAKHEEIREDRECFNYGRRYITLYDSARLGRHDNNCCIEGDSEEMIGIANAILTKSEFGAKRCAAKWVAEGVELDSPRNSRRPVLVVHDAAVSLAHEILAKVRDGQPAAIKNWDTVDTTSLGMGDE